MKREREKKKRLLQQKIKELKAQKDVDWNRCKLGVTGIQVFLFLVMERNECRERERERMGNGCLVLTMCD